MVGGAYASPSIARPRLRSAVTSLSCLLLLLCTAPAPAAGEAAARSTRVLPSRAQFAAQTVNPSGKHSASSPTDGARGGTRGAADGSGGQAHEPPETQRIQTPPPAQGPAKHDRSVPVRPVGAGVPPDRRASGPRAAPPAGVGSVSGQGTISEGGEGSAQQAPAEPQVGAPAATVRGERGKHRHPREPKHPHRPPSPQPPPPSQKPAPQPTLAPPVALTASAPPSVVAPATAPVAPVRAAGPRILAEPVPAAGPVPTAKGVGARRRRAVPKPAATLAVVAPALTARTSTVVSSPPPELGRGVGGAPVKASTPRRSAHGADSPLVTTVTKIIGVVPAAVRFLIAGLVALALALGAASRMAALRARRLARQRLQLLDDVGLLQAALLPDLPARLGPVGTTAAYRPSSGPAAGGDFYDAFALADGQLAVIMGDVSGHGRDALGQTTLVRFTLRAYLEAGLSPRGALAAAAPALERQLGDSLVTVVLATYEPRARKLVYSCAGHPPPLVVGAGSPSPVTICAAPPIGAGRPTGTRQTTVSIPGGALACFYTDGVIEARVGGELFGEPRLRELLAGLEPGASASMLLDRVAEESDQRPDDMAACLLRMEGEPLAPTVVLEELELDDAETRRGRARRFLIANGLDGAEIEEVLGDARREVTRDGRVLLELSLLERPLQVSLRRQNVATLQQPLQSAAQSGGMR